ncbi:MAG: NADP-dependent phosphogluconate dehydrogenase [Elusimicrobia bacterium]|nr:NADP-dependent phosphogluconate dehydrogenase [Elusimicrobiota bacterium]
MPEEKKSQIGVIGLAVMGRNLALNIEERGYTVAVWNRDTEKIRRLIQTYPQKRFVPCADLKTFLQSLEKPRRILLMIKAGAPLDAMLEKLTPHLEKGDILIDGGNSWFQDTQRREAAFKRQGIYYFGSGVSGGEEGARHGPSLMPGGDAQAYEHIRPVWEAIAAKTESGPCVTYIGPDGAGHFVKMVHNGIEYGDMQLIAEAYDLLKRVLGCAPRELSDIFLEWNRGELESFLIELTAKVFQVQDEKTRRPLVDLVQDKAGQKGTGRWSVQAALDLGVPIPTIAAAVDARVLSGMKEERVSAESKIPGTSRRAFSGDKKAWMALLQQALLASKICSYAQGMRLIQAGSEQYHWDVSLKEVARIWKGGCIIRARFLDSILQAYEKKPNLQNLLLDATFNQKIQEAQAGWRQVVQTACAWGIPVPAMSASLAYFDGYRTGRLPQNLTQAQRDAFGAHTYERIDQPQKGFIHTDWLSS